VGYRINLEIYTPYTGAAGMLLHINGKFTMGKSFVAKFRSERPLTVNFEV
jgi:hypothetical protein